MIRHLHELAKMEPPTYAIVRDLFDQTDILKDGVIDLNEWSQTFLNNRASAASPLQIRSMKADMISLVDPTAQWVTTKDYGALLNQLTKHRKPLLLAFMPYDSGDKVVPLAKGREVFGRFLRD